MFATANVCPSSSIEVISDKNIGRSAGLIVGVLLLLQVLDVVLRESLGKN